MDNQKTEKSVFSVKLRKTIKWLLYWSLIPAFLNGLLACFIIACMGIPSPVVFIFGFVSYFIQPITALVWIIGILAILIYSASKDYGIQFPKVIKRRVSPKKLLILWIMVPLLAYTIPYCLIIIGQASVRATSYEPFRWDYAIFGYFIYLFLIAAVTIPYGVYVVIILFTLWVMGVAKLYKDYRNKREQRIHE